MKNQESDQIAGVKISEIKGLFQKVYDKYFYYDFIPVNLNVGEDKAQDLFKEFIKLDLIEKKEFGYQLTKKGVDISKDGEKRPLKRKKAEQQLDLFVNRAMHVNSNYDYIYNVIKIVVFGDYITSEKWVNSIDVSINLKEKYDKPLFDKKLSRMIALAEDEGIHFKSVFDEIFYAEKQIIEFLKEETTHVRIHDFIDPEKEQQHFKVVYKFP
jgi:hypothetical protein